MALLGQLARGLHAPRDEPERAIPVADRVLAVAERADLVGLVADTLVTKGTALANLGRGYEGSGVIETGLRLAERHGLTVTALRARNNLGAFLSMSDPRTALDIARVGLADARRLGQQAWVAGFLVNASEASLWTGDWDEALHDLARTARRRHRRRRAVHPHSTM